MVQWVKNLTAVAWVVAAAWIQYLAWELPYAMGVAKKKKKKKNPNQTNTKRQQNSYRNKGL